MSDSDTVAVFQWSDYAIKPTQANLYLRYMYMDLLLWKMYELWLEVQGSKPESQRNLFLKFSVFRCFNATKFNYEYAESNNWAYRSYCYKSFHCILILIFVKGNILFSSVFLFLSINWSIIFGNEKNKWGRKNFQYNFQRDI